MIEREITIIMRCDKCGDVLIDDLIKCVIRLNDDRFAYARIRARAIDMGWKCSEDSCLCPACKEEAAK